MEKNTIEKQCLNCQKPYMATFQTSKYCSDSCRVLYNRTHKDREKELSTKKKIDAIYEWMKGLSSSKVE